MALTMIDLLRWALNKHQPSKETARQRLRLILILDRVGLAPEYMDAMKKDMIQVVSKYLIVDEGSIEVAMKRSDDSLVLVSNIPVKEVVRTFAAR